MYPYWLEIGGFRLPIFGLEIDGFRLPTFGPMVVLGFLAAHFFVKKELQRKGTDPELASAVITAGILGGLGGAKLYFVLFELCAQSWRELLGGVFSGSGLTFYGGLVVGAAAVVWVIRRHGAPLASTADAIGIGLAIGYAIGRIGCQLAGDGDYGVPTDLPWGMAYPDGVVPTLARVHPAPVYETLMGLATFSVLWRTRRRILVPGLSFCLYLVMTGIARLSVEFVRLNPKVLWGLTAAQFISVLLMAVGVAGVVYLLTARGGSGREGSLEPSGPGGG